MDNFKNDSSIFCYNVAMLRKQHHLSKKQMAKILGIGIGSLNKLESGILPPRMDVKVAFNIFDAFDIHPKDLFGKKFN